MNDPFQSSIIGTIESVLRQNGYYLMLRTIETSEDLLSFLQTWNIDGLFFTGMFKDAFYDAAVRLKIPMVLIDSYVRQPHIHNIGLEDFQGSYNATRYLAAHGHKKIAFASPAFQDGGVLQERFLGYKSALTEASIPVSYTHLTQIHYANSIENLILQVESGLGFSVLDENSSIMRSSAVRAIPINDQGPLALVAIWHKNNLNPAIPLFVNMLIEQK